jgi:MFS transporter, CP family, cyanate transporter
VTTTSGRTTSRTAAPVLLVVTVLVVATNLRATITSVGPVLDLISTDTGLSAAALGVLGAIPLIAFAVVSPVVHHLSRRVGAERAVLLALLVLIFATVLRSLAWPGALWVGTAVIGCAIAVGNVLVPAIVKRDFPHKIAVMTGAYSAVLSAFAATASGLSLPIAQVSSWRVAIGIWVILSVIAAITWLPRVLRHRQSITANAAPADGARRTTMWTSATAWQVALFMGAQSTTFYFFVTWLPSIEVAFGVDPVVAGWHLFGFQAVGIAAGLGVTAFMHGRSDLRLVAGSVSALMIIAMIGLAVAPALVVVWILVAGLSAGASLVVSLTFVAQRARTAADAGRLSGMVQGVGYLLAALGPLAAGVLLDVTGTFTVSLRCGAALAAFQLLLGLLAGRDRYTHRD